MPGLVNLGLTWRLMRGGGLLGPLLTFAAVTVASGLLLFAAAADHAFAQRADADAWRHPAASGTATAVEALSTDHVRGRPVTVVDLAALEPSAPVPPGLPRFPRPGETWTSPALAAQMRRLPADQLADRFPARAGNLGDAALVHPGELVAVVGRAPGDPAMTAERLRNEGSSPAVRIDRFARGAVSTVPEMYRVLAAIASVLMIVPLLVFGGAAARLTVARRDARLAALRLVGATPGQVVAMTVAEAVLTACGGAVAGALLYAFAVPALVHLEFGGGGWYAADLWPPLPWLLGVLLAVPLLVGLSAAAGLRRVVVSPLGVARRVTPPGLRAVRVAALAAVLLAFAVFAGTWTGLGRAGAVVLLVLLGSAFLASTWSGRGWWRSSGGSPSPPRAARPGCSPGAAWWTTRAPPGGPSRASRSRGSSRASSGC
ncbi:ABC transporter permease [Actinomadura parmotrematis]|uniref:ABC transporter permease n=1 Tax=Actinomadura parmotrematis TaxID=2864039 RepID=UPI00215D8576|nr:ABC transporter permease [Actinomadura parmotrematis]